VPDRLIAEPRSTASSHGLQGRAVERGRPAELLLRLGLDPAGRRGQAGSLLAEALPALAACADSVRPPLAVMLGCGVSVEALELLREGWVVVSYGETPTPAPRTARLTIDTTEIKDAVFPPADLIYTGASLPFRPQDEFILLWGRIVRALSPGGWFIGHLLGDRDSWADDPDMTALTRNQIVTLLNGFQIEALRERDDDIASSESWIHSHTWSVVARRGRFRLTHRSP
jgi:hypothetical protein